MSLFMLDLHAPAIDRIPVQHDFSQIGVFAPAPAELIAPPTVRHHPERPAATVTDLSRAQPGPRGTIPIPDRRHDALARSVSADTMSLSDRGSTRNCSRKDAW